MTDEVDVRGLLEGASRIDGDERVVPDAPWGAGRRRRTRKRVGGGVASALATVAAGALVWQTGVLGGGDGLDGVAAEFPPGGTTFVFADAATPSAQTPDPAALSAVTPVDAGELTGTRWTLQEDLWRGGDSAEVVGADAATELAFPAVGGGWGVSVDGCGQAMATGALRLEPDGAFAPQELMTTDLGCPAQVQAAEDFWMEALAGGGSLHRLGGEQAGLLLLTVVAPTTDEPVAATTPEPTGPDPVRTDSTSPDPDPTGAEPDPTGAAQEPDPPGPTSVEPTEDPEDPADPVQEPEPSAQEPSPQETEPVAPVPAPQPPVVDPGTGVDPGGGAGPELPWTDPVVRTEGGGGVAAGGALYAPSVRAGRHDGFDRVVVDLTGAGPTTGPGWVASYEASPTRGGSGLPAGVAGDSVLQLVLAGMAYPAEGDPVYDGGDYGLDTHSLGAVVEVIRTTPFEGQLQVFVGMHGEPRPYRVFTLGDPLRLVVDVDTGAAATP